MDRTLAEFALSIARRLDERFGKKTIAAKLTDVPGHTIGLVPVLARAGVEYLHIGVNGASYVPEVPPVFRWLAETGNVAPDEMMRTFNCGVGMVIVVASGQAAQVAAVLQEAGETVTPIGRIVPRRDAGVIYRGSIDL